MIGNSPIVVPDVIIAVLNVAVRAAHYAVPFGYRCFIRPKSTNAGVVRVADNPTAAVNGPSDFVNATDLEREWPVDATSKIWIAGAANDGLSIILRPAQPARGVDVSASFGGAQSPAQGAVNNQGGGPPQQGGGK